MMGTVLATKRTQQFTFLSQKQSALLVYGYIRLKFDTQKCPDDIMELCLEWYESKKDQWNLNYVPDGVEVNGNTATLIDKDSIFAHKTVVGSTLISKAIDMKQWRLQYVADAAFFIIGLLPNDEEIIQSGHAFNNGYGLDVWNGTIKVPDYQFFSRQRRIDMLKTKGSNIITMKYVTALTNDNENKTCGELYVGVNGQPLQKILDNVQIDNDEMYLFAVSLFSRGEAVQLLQ